MQQLLARIVEPVNTATGSGGDGDVVLGGRNAAIRVGHLDVDSVGGEEGEPVLRDVAEVHGQTHDEAAAQNGVSADDFSKAYNSFSVSSNLQRAEEMTQRYHVQGVPFFVVNGKYSSDVAKAGSEAKLIELINDLAASEHATH